VASASDIGLHNCMTKYNKLNEFDRSIVQLIKNTEYFNDFVYVLNHTEDCSFWFSDYGEYTRFSSPAYRGYELTNLIDIDHKNYSDLDERLQKLNKIIGSLFTLPPFYENPLGFQRLNSIEEKIMRLYFGALFLYSNLGEEFIKFANNDYEEELSNAGLLWNVTTRKVYLSNALYLYRSLKPSGQLIVAFVTVSKFYGIGDRELVIGITRYHYNTIQIQDSYLRLTCAILNYADGYKIFCKRFNK